jgi:pSer/pThr/pTyr-binding forkhead associated (FHA) protein
MHNPSIHYVLTVASNGRELGSWKVDGGTTKVGRTPDNHIVIDDPAVSHLHAVIDVVTGGLMIRDCDSRTGVALNGVRVERAMLTHGDVVTIGGHQIVCQVVGPDGQVASDPALFEATILSAGDGRDPEQTPGVLTETSPDRERQHAINRGLLTIGSDEAADVVINGRNIAPCHAEIRLLDGHYLLRHLDGRTRIKVNGKSIQACALEDGCAITIGEFSFRFHATANAATPRS